MVHIDRNEAGAAHGESKPVRNNAQGWGAATLTILLALACALGAWWLHVETYYHPRDPGAAVSGQTGGH